MNSTLIAVPCFNEEERFNQSYWKDICKILSDVNFVFIDDGSLDKTFEVISGMTSLSNCSVLRNEYNLGKAKSILQSFSRDSAKNYDVVGFIDSDGAFDKNDIEKNVRSCHNLFYDQDFEAIFSSRIQLAGRKINRKRVRHYISRVIYTLLNFKLKIPLYDTQSGFKLYKNSAFWRKALNQEPKTRWFLDIELILEFRRQNNRNPKIWEEPLETWIEVPGSKIKINNYLRVLKDLLVLVFRY